MRVGVREGTETVVIFLASGIPEGELDVLAVYLDVGDIVLEDGGDIDLQAQVSADGLGGTCAQCSMRVMATMTGDVVAGAVVVVVMAGVLGRVACAHGGRGQAARLTRLRDGGSRLGRY